MTPTTTYRQQLLSAAPRLLSSLDREPLSPTYGSFDRDHWAWKFRDFPVVMLQMGVLSLSWLYRHPFAGNEYARNPRLLQWIEGALRTTLARQHRNGAFDSVGPFTQDHGATLACVYLCVTVARDLEAELPPSLVAETKEAMARAGRFAQQSAEDYAFISNHHALFALAWLRLGRWLHNQHFISESHTTTHEILRRQSPEGWYLEYGGPDPGYESLGIHYLAQLAKESGDSQLDASLIRAVEFYQNWLHPDGSLANVGSRHTQLWYPGGFELLGSRLPLARSIARRVLGQLAGNRVVTLQTVDIHNLPSLLHSYCVGAEYAAEAVDTPPASLPCDQPAAPRFLAESGLVVASTLHYHAVVATKRGGALSVRGREGSFAHEDAGYVGTAGDERSFSGLLNTSSGELKGEELVVRGRFMRVRREVLTPLKFLILRVLNLTLFRSIAMGAAIRKVIIGRLILDRDAAPLSLVRTIHFDADCMRIDDSIASTAPSEVHVSRESGYTAIHMGSARYFHGQELVLTGEPAAVRIAAGEQAHLSLKLPISSV